MSDEWKSRQGVLGPSGLKAADLDTQIDKRVKEQGILPAFKTRPQIGELFNSSYFILHEQFKMYVTKLAEGTALDKDEIRAATQLMKVLTDLSKEERATLAQLMEGEAMSTEEIQELLEEAQKRGEK